MIGPPGTAKTEIVAYLGAAMRESSRRKHPDRPQDWFKYHIYDASKINFEDLIGWPDVQKLKDDKEVAFIPSPTTIWDKQLIGLDELNRCVKERQSNFFEIIRSRKLCGMPTGVLFIFSSMNPFQDVGTEEMSDALVDRHLFYLRFNAFDEMMEEDREKVMVRTGALDSVGLRYWTKKDFQLDISDDKVNDYLADIGDDINKVVEKAGEVYEELEADMEEFIHLTINRMVTRFRSEFKGDQNKVKDNIRITGRRATMMRKAALAYRAIEMASGCLLGQKMDKPEAAFYNCFQMCIPVGVAGKVDVSAVERAFELVKDTVLTTWKTVRDSKDSKIPVDVLYELAGSEDPFRKLEILLDYDIESMSKKKAWSDIKFSDAEDERGPSISTMLYLLSLKTTLVPPHLIDDEMIERAKKETSHENDIIEVPDVIAFYKEEILDLRERVKDNPAILFTMKAATAHYSRTVKTEEQALLAIKRMRHLIKTLEDRKDIWIDDKPAQNEEDNKKDNT
jgi:hypothetical protein